MTSAKPLRHGGFTLIELMTTLAVLAVLASLAAPSFVSFQRNSELTSFTNKLVAAANTARSEAMKTGRNAFVIPAGDGSAWSAGWIVFVDLNGNGSYDQASDSTVLTERAPPSYIAISGTNNSGASAPYLGFGNSGYARSKSSGSAANAVMTIKRNDTSQAAADAETRRVIVALTGRVRACRPSSDQGCTTDATD